MNDTTTKINVYVTTDYGRFKVMKGNRQISTRHLGQLAKSFAQEDLSTEVPIVVNEKMEVIDGQHRLAFRSANNLPVYYTIKNGAGLATVQRLNAVSKRWGIVDYLNSHIELGNVEYKKLKDAMTTYGISHVSVAETLFGNSTEYFIFRRGDFKMIDEQTVEIRGAAFKILKETIHDHTVTDDQDFARAVKILIDKVPVEDLLAKLSASGKEVTRAFKANDYLRQFEDILNWKRQGDPVRLF